MGSGMEYGGDTEGRDRTSTGTSRSRETRNYYHIYYHFYSDGHPYSEYVYDYGFYHWGYFTGHNGPDDLGKGENCKFDIDDIGYFADYDFPDFYMPGVDDIGDFAGNAEVAANRHEDVRGCEHEDVRWWAEYLCWGKRKFYGNSSQSSSSTGGDHSTAAQMGRPGRQRVATIHEPAAAMFPIVLWGSV